MLERMPTLRWGLQSVGVAVSKCDYGQRSGLISPLETKPCVALSMAIAVSPEGRL